MQNLLASMEAELNTTSNQHQQAPDNEQLKTKKEMLRELLNDYICLQNRFKEIQTISH